MRDLRSADQLLRHRTYEEGKKIGFKDGVAAFWYILKFNLMTDLNKSYRQVPKLPQELTTNFILDSND